MFGIGMQELAIILVVALLVFGPKRLPDLARTLGKGLAEFRRASTDLRQSFSLDGESPSIRPATPRPEPDPKQQRESDERPLQAVDAVSTPDSGIDEDGHGDMADDADTEPASDGKGTER